MKLKPFIPALALLGTMAGPALSSEPGNYPNLPGVRSQQQIQAQENGPDCTSEMVTRDFFDRWHMPQRIYTCRQGSLSYGSTSAPIGVLRPADPYIHGDGPLKASGYEK